MKTTYIKIIATFLLLGNFAAKAQFFCSATIAHTINAGHVTFTVTPSVPSGWTCSYLWEFEVNHGGSGSPASYTYGNNGTYSPFLTMIATDPTDSTNTCTTYVWDSLAITGATGDSCWAAQSSTYNGMGNYDFTGMSTSTFANYTTYTTWTVNGVVVGTGANLNYTFPGTGIYYLCSNVKFVDNVTGDSCFAGNCNQVSYNTLNSCHANFSLVQDSLNPTVYNGYNLCVGTGPLTYLWTFGDGTSSTAQYPSHTYATTGYYHVCLTVYGANGCSDTKCDTAGVFKMATGGISQLNILNTTSVKETENNVGISVFPNPLTENSSISINAEKAMKLQMNITNVLGQTVSSEQLAINQGKNSVLLKTNELNSGIYFLAVCDGNKIIKNIKLVK